jgi:serine/threonine protein kinase
MAPELSLFTNHPNICTNYDIGEQGGKAFIAMEYLHGATLKHLISGQAMKLERLLDVAIQVTEGLRVPPTCMATESVCPLSLKLECWDRASGYCSSGW